MPEKKFSYFGKKVLVIGLGLHGGGVSAVRWFVRHGATVRVTDMKPAKELKPSLRALRGLPIIFHLGRQPTSDLGWADVVYQNQGVPSSLPALERVRRLGIPIVNEVTIFFQHCPAPIIGVTGTRGKSTTTALLFQMIKQRFSRSVVTGNIRQVPMLDLLDRLQPNHVVVAELSSFQLEFLPRVKRSPNVSIMTNLKVDHLNRYTSLTTYARAKYQIFRWQKPNDTAVLNYDSAWTRRAADVTPGRIIWFSGQSQPPGWSVYVKDNIVWENHQGRRKIMRVPSFFRVGQHRQENLLAAVAAARAWGVTPQQIRRAASGFSGLPHRQELVRRWKNHQFINDTTATTPDGTLAAFDVWPQGVFIVGGTDKRLDFKLLAKVLTRHNVPLVFLPGNASDRLYRDLRRAGYHGHHAFAGSMPVAVRKAIRMSHNDQPIVLSPGAASFGLFQHEFDRGEQFVRAVKRLPA